jgi:hypothetical protein
MTTEPGPGCKAGPVGLLLLACSRCAFFLHLNFCKRFLPCLYIYIYDVLDDFELSLSLSLSIHAWCSCSLVLSRLCLFSCCGLL